MCYEKENSANTIHYGVENQSEESPEQGADISAIPDAQSETDALSNSSDNAEDIEDSTEEEPPVAAEGDTASEDDESTVQSVSMFRLYNPNSGEHFYTKSPVERRMLVTIGWQAEGIGWYAPSTSNTPVYRLYNPNTGDHHYTRSAEERELCVGNGWNYEGIGWYSDDNKSVPL